jgi:ATP adenylyltransferase/5',5'''-P-1,P-4-tetraphosphate phosphorylase II
MSKKKSLYEKYMPTAIVIVIVVAAILGLMNFNSTNNSGSPNESCSLQWVHYGSQMNLIENESTIPLIASNWSSFNMTLIHETIISSMLNEGKFSDSIGWTRDDGVVCHADGTGTLCNLPIPAGKDFYYLNNGSVDKLIKIPNVLNGCDGW